MIVPVFWNAWAVNFTLTVPAKLEPLMRRVPPVENDPRLLTRAVLGLYNSVWHWYRPGGTLLLRDVGKFFVSRQLAILGCPPDLADDRYAELAAAA